MLVATFILASLVALVYIYLKTKRASDLADKFPGPPALPILGNIFNFSASSTEGKIKIAQVTKSINISVF